MTMAEVPKKYTLEEEEKIFETVEQALRDHKALEPVFEQLGEELERSWRGIENRYYVVKKRKQNQKQDDAPQEQEEFQFTPYVEEQKKRIGRPRGQTLKHYTHHDDERIWETMTFADDEGIPRAAIYEKLAEELDRTPKAIEARCKILKKQRSETHDEEDEDDDGGGILSKLKSIVKERDMYKSKYESAEEKLKDYERMAKELRQIRRLLE